MILRWQSQWVVPLTRMMQSPKQTHFRRPETEEARTAKARTTSAWPSSRTTNKMPQRHRKMPLNHSSPLKRMGLFPLKYWVQALTGHARHFLGKWHVTPRTGYGGPWEKAEWLETRFMWKCQFEGLSGPSPCSKLGHNIKVMKLSPCFHCSKPSQSM